MLEIKNLRAGIEGREILKGINLTINKGEIHAIMGPNGSGKSTLAKVLAGHPQYEVTSGEILYEGRNLLEMSPDERAREGVFMAFQYPIEVPGVSNAQFLRLAYNEKRKHLGEEELEAHALASLGQVSLSAHDLGGAAEYFERSRAVRHTIGDRVGEGWMHLRLAGLRHRIGDRAGALDAQAAAAAAAAETNDGALLAACAEGVRETSD